MKFIQVIFFINTMQVLDLYIYCLFRVFTRRIFRYLILYVNPPIPIMTKFFYCGVGCSYLTFDFLFKTDPRFFLIFIFRNFYFNTSGYRTQCPLTGFEKKNVSKVCHIFLESISYDNSKMV